MAVNFAKLLDRLRKPSSLFIASWPLVLRRPVELAPPIKPDTRMKPENILNDIIDLDDFLS